MARSRYTQLPQQTADEEMYAAFDNGEDDAGDEGHGAPDSRPLLGQHQRQTSETHPLDSSSADNLHNLSNNSNTRPSPTRHGSSRSVAGTYDFEFDYAMLPPPGSPPRPSQLALPNAYGNSNGLLPTNAPVAAPHPSSFFRRAMGAILPTHYAHDRRGGGLGNDGVFGNVVAKPGGPGAVRGIENADGPYFVPEETQKDAPPSYQSAQADSVPPYWENTILAPSGPMDGDMVIDNLPVGSVFAFLWNLLVSVSFQFVGFLLTYLLHTTHASKYGSRAGLGITLIQYGFYMRSAEAQLPVADDATMWGWANVDTPDNTVSSRASSVAAIAKRALPILMRSVTVDNNGTATVPPNNGPFGPFSTAIDGSSPSSNPSSFTPNDWLSFILMTIGWFLLITSFLGFWRVKRWQRGVQASVVAAERERDPTPEDLARNAQVLRSLEQAFGISWDAERQNPGGLVAGFMSPTTASAVSPAVQPPLPRPRADGGLVGLHAALSAPTPAAEPPAHAESGGEAATVETDSRQGTRRLFRLQF